MPKKGVTMDLGSFLKDDQFGGDSWADDFNMDDLSVDLTAGAGAKAATGGEREREFGSRGASRREAMGGAGRFGSREREEYPVPDEPPFTARVNNLAHEMDESELYELFVEGLGLKAAKEEITDFYAPKDRATGQLRGFAFVTFAEKALLEQALTLSPTELAGRTVYISVAAPDRRGGMGMGMGSHRGGRMPNEPEPVLDFGAARDTQESQPAQQGMPPRRGSRAPRGPQEPEPVLDWGAARDTRESVPAREDSRGGRRFGTEFRERRERSEREPEREFDFGAARETTEQPPAPAPGRSFGRGREEREPRKPREPREPSPELDWGAARGSQVQQPRQRASPGVYRPPRHERKFFRRDDDDSGEVDFAAARNSQEAAPAGRRQPSSASSTTDSESSTREGSRSFSSRSGRERKFRASKPDETPEIDWSNVRGSGLGELAARRKSRAKFGRNDRRRGRQEMQESKREGQNKRESQDSKREPQDSKRESHDGPTKSRYELLNLAGDDEEDDEVSANLEAVAKKTANLSLEGDGWEVAGKK